MEERKDHLWKVDAEERTDDLARAGANPMGIDVGTSKIVAARRRSTQVETAAQLNAFHSVPYSKFTENILGSQGDVSYYRDGDELVVYGSATERFANMF